MLRLIQCMLSMKFDFTTYLPTYYLLSRLVYRLAHLPPSARVNKHSEPVRDDIRLVPLGPFPLNQGGLYTTTLTT